MLAPHSLDSVRLERCRLTKKGVTMDIKSTQTGSSLVVNLENVANKNAVLETIQGCADGNCACSTDEYQKVETMQILPGPDSIQLNIEVKAGEVIDPNCISECLAPLQE